MKRLRNFICFLIFVCVLGASLSYANRILMRKSLDKPWDMGNKIGGYFNEKKDYDIMFFGTSHAYCSIIPSMLEEKGITSYILASQKQPLEANYFYIDAALSISHPKVVYLDIFDALSKTETDEATVHSYTDYFPFGLSKIRMITEAVPKGMKLHTLFPLLMYHSRWDVLKDEDWHFKYSMYHDDLNGYVKLTGQSPSFSKDKTMKKENLEAIKLASGKFMEDKIATIVKISKLCKKNGVELRLIKTPVYDETVYSENLKEFSKLCEEKGLNFYDFNGDKDKIGLIESDFYDPGHLNEEGAEKFTRFFIDWMGKN